MPVIKGHTNMHVKAGQVSAIIRETQEPFCIISPQCTTEILLPVQTKYGPQNTLKLIFVGLVYNHAGALYKLQEADCLCDIWICTKTRMVPVHRLMLEAFTGPLCNTSVKDGTSSISNFIDICSRFDRSIVLILVRYLYTGEVIIEVELISEFIKLCKLLDLDSVVLGVETEMEFLNKNMKQEVTYFDDNTGFCPERTLQHAIPVSLITNKNNESETFEDSFIQQNSDFVQEVKKEVAAESFT
ncbi:KLHL38 [Mytilus edulis]|uniref:KLHL38 n=1 Tax=Mytilus edulis TaxID=6550 RepID=A0A8S3RK52_MYTED|nr:KLHL38 [Mytilus edulis]